MKKCWIILLLVLPFFANAQMLVYSVAGYYPYHSGPLGDGGPATAAKLGSTEGYWERRFE